MDKKITQFDVYEIMLISNVDTIDFISPSGKKYKVNTFLKADKKLYARCYIDEKGIWKYSENNKNYEFVCEGNSDNLHGKITTCGINNRKFCYQDKSPYYMLGFECDWLFHIDDKCKDISKTSVLLRDVAENNFNMIICNLWANDVKFKGAQGRGTCYDFSNPLETPFSRNADSTLNYNELNYEYFDRIDKIFDLAKDLNVVIHLMIYVWNKRVEWAKLFSEQDNAMFKYVIDRYSAYPNLIWDISKEALNKATNEEIDKKCSLAKELDPFGTMLTVHDDTFCRNNPKSVGIHSIQNWDYDVFNVMLEINENALPNPILNIEHGGYERGIYDVFMGSYDDPHICIERNYIIAFAGAYTSYYWQNASWNIVIWDYKSLLPANQPKYSYYKNLHKYLKYMNYEKAYPVDSQCPCKMCMDDGEYYYYLKLKGTRCVTINRKQEVIDAQTLEWYNPITDEFAHTETDSFRGCHALVCPFDQDFSILRVKHQ